MIRSLWHWSRRLPRLLRAPPREPAQHGRRILTLHRDVVLPAKFVIMAVVFHYLYRSAWVDEAANVYGVVLETLRDFFGFYILLNLLVEVSFLVMRHFPLGAVQWVVFVLGLVDGVFLAGLTLLTGGFDSVLYWVFPGLIVLNAVCIPLATPQIMLNLMLSVFFLLAGLLEPDFRNVELTVPRLPPRAQRRPVPPVNPQELRDARAIVIRLQRQGDSLARLVWQRIPAATRDRLLEMLKDPAREEELAAALADELNRLLPAVRYVVQPSEPPEDLTEPFLLRLAILWLLTFCCYGVQVLAAKQEQAEAEQKEFAARTEQLHAAGRVAAEFAHQIKNPLAVINNAAFTIKRLLGDRSDAAQPVQIIQEEVQKADRIITQIMGYAALSEGRVEKLNVAEELDRAIAQVFPPGIHTETRVSRDYAPDLPPLVMQREHLADVFVNLLQNARQAIEDRGHIRVSARCRGEDEVEVTVADDGPGVPPDKQERIFEPYYSLRPNGTGLGLAIVKHNVELYGGTVRVESELGKGARFIVFFPARTATNLAAAH